MYVQCFTDIVITFMITFVIIMIFIIELTHSKTILGNSLKIKPQPAALDFENFS